MTIRKIKTKTVAPFAFLHAAKTTAYEKVPEVGGKIMDGLMPWAKGNAAALAGSAIWTYQSQTPGKLKLKAGFQVKPGTAAPKPYAVSTEPAWECLSAEYQGPMTLILDAWYDLMDAAEKRGLDCSEDRREIYHKWVAFDSQANVTELQIRLRSKVAPQPAPKPAKAAPAGKTAKAKTAARLQAKPKAKKNSAAAARAPAARVPAARPGAKKSVAAVRPIAKKPAPAKQRGANKPPAKPRKGKA